MRGPKVFKGYWRDPEATVTAFAGGWFHTGDVGVRDDDGYLFIVDRFKDMIVSGVRTSPVPRSSGCSMSTMRCSRRRWWPDPMIGGARFRWPLSCCAPVRRRRPTCCSTTAAPSWPASRCRRRSPSSLSCPATPPARCSNATFGTADRAASDAPIPRWSRPGGGSDVHAAVDPDHLTGDVAALLGHRNEQAAAMSAGVPARPNGTIGPITSTPGKSPAASALRAIGVSTRLGGMVLTVIPFRASSTANALVRPMTPPLEAA